MTFRNTRPLLATLLLLGTIGCAKNVADDECVRKLAANIKVGMSEAAAEKSLDQCGFSHSVDERSDTIVAIKRGEKTGAVRQDWSVQIKLDDEHNVLSVKVEKVFTGP